MMAMMMAMAMLRMMIMNDDGDDYVQVHDDGPHWDRPDNVRTSKAGRIHVYSHGRFSQVRESVHSQHQFCFHCFSPFTFHLLLLQESPCPPFLDSSWSSL